MNYGYINDELAVKMANKICDCIGHGKYNTAVEMILETAVVETGLGRIEDKTPKSAGLGITQFDKIPFEDIRYRSRKLREKILKELKVDIELVEWEELKYNAFLSLIFTRLHYWLKGDPIPKTMDERAAYWKLHYNTKFGKGTVEHYLEMNRAYGVKVD
ncbi:hypothetical protein AAX26_01821 [Aliarcobacter thereius]|uniref:hypothetical protein n=1 Tax=Aliarcobacter thereius TaxID=544718 RepID=UPI000827BCAD|nr:hypothetical protein [Aliarcobacter thereius]OCL85754.1 hypothetical protein AAX26_01821 [Aliarcobacter thereius]